MSTLSAELETTLAALQRSADHLARLEQYNSQQAEALTSFQRKAVAMACKGESSSSRGPDLAAAVVQVPVAFDAQKLRHDELDTACRQRVMVLHEERMHALLEYEKSAVPDLADLAEVEELRTKLEAQLREQAHLEGLTAELDAKHTGLRSHRLAMEERIGVLRQSTSSATHLSDAILRQQLK